MLLVKTIVQQYADGTSTGLFLADTLDERRAAWAFDSRVDRLHSKLAVFDFSDTAHAHVMKYGWWYETLQCFIVRGDDARFMRHSTEPTLVLRGDAMRSLVAAENLAIGDELTCNYSHLCDYFADNQQDVQRAQEAKKFQEDWASKKLPFTSWWPWRFS